MQAQIVILSILFTIILLIIQIPVIKNLNFGQPIRKEGNQGHLSKSGTPTMGGIAFIISFLIISILFVKIDSNFIFIILSTLAFGIIGFIDDFEKVTKNSSLGLSERQKLLIQIITSFVLLLVFYFILPIPMGNLEIPFFNSSLNLGILSIPILVFIMVGSVNAVNFTDGIDGLLSSVSIPILIGIFIMTSIEKSSIAGLALSLIGALIGFLVFNTYPASIFMGDTGSMAIGGAIVSMLIAINKPIYLVIIGGIFFIEALSVIIQRIYFKKTNGKRFFKMTPIHHHFELEGYKETKIVATFTTISVLLTLLTLVII